MRITKKAKRKSVNSEKLVRHKYCIIRPLAASRVNTRFTTSIILLRVHYSVCCSTTEYCDQHIQSSVSVTRKTSRKVSFKVKTLFENGIT
ncbi:unnamed protein product [Arctia plantaginis]|uniref:Uncharacterized protein n=1 Tax=Arctia plantaginis TaxID=874455 RepID=A0A8S1B766_ARCPL|nr:unnamed protein product [Arctia plantaginis]